MSPHDRRPSGALPRLARRVARIIAECNYAQRRMAALRMSPDSYLVAPQNAPDAYNEFLLRTSGQLPHEPSARQRGTGAHPVS